MHPKLSPDHLRDKGWIEKTHRLGTKNQYRARIGSIRENFASALNAVCEYFLDYSPKKAAAFQTFEQAIAGPEEAYRRARDTHANQRSPVSTNELHTARKIFSAALCMHLLSPHTDEDVREFVRTKIRDMVKEEKIYHDREATLS